MDFDVHRISAIKQIIKTHAHTVNKESERHKMHSMVRIMKHEFDTHKQACTAMEALRRFNPESVNYGDHVLIVGAPGSGKTTMVRRLLVAMACRHGARFIQGFSESPMHMKRWLTNLGLPHRVSEFDSFTLERAMDRHVSSTVIIEDMFERDTVYSDDQMKRLFKLNRCQLIATCCGVKSIPFHVLGQFSIIIGFKVDENLKFLHKRVFKHHINQRDLFKVMFAANTVRVDGHPMAVVLDNRVLRRRRALVSEECLFNYYIDSWFMKSSFHRLHWSLRTFPMLLKMLVKMLAILCMFLVILVFVLRMLVGVLKHV